MWMERSRVETLGAVVLQTAILSLSLFVVTTVSLSQSESDAMQQLKKGLDFSSSSIKWSNADPCQWDQVGCELNHVTRIQLMNRKLSGTLSPAISNLTSLKILELKGNNLKGPLPSLKGLVALETLNLMENHFESIPPDFFDGLSALTSVYLDSNPFSPWSIPGGLQSAISLANFSAVSANVVGKIPDFFNASTFPSLVNLHMSFNALGGGLPLGFAGLPLQTLWINGQKDANGARTLNGTIEVLQNMTQLVQIWLNMNSLTGPIPDLSGLSALQELNLRDNSLTGPVPPSLTKMQSLKVVNLTNNALQGPTPKFGPSVGADILPNQNSFCLPDPGVACDSRVTALISVLEPLGYPLEIANAWKGNDPCSGGNVSVINLQNKKLRGTISPNFAALTSVQTLVLAHNNIFGTIPDSLTTMPNLKTLDLSYNNLDVNKAPTFTHTSVNVANNIAIIPPPPPAAGKTGGTGSAGKSGSSEGTSGKKSGTGIVVGAVIGGVCVVLFVGVLIFWFMKRKPKHRKEQLNTIVIHPRPSDSDGPIKISVVGGGANVNSTNDGLSQASSNTGDVRSMKESCLTEPRFRNNLWMTS